MTRVLTLLAIIVVTGGFAPAQNPDPPPTHTTPNPSSSPSILAAPATPIGNIPHIALPEAIRRRSSSFSVQIEVTIDANGATFYRLIASTGEPDLDRNIEETLRSWKWSSARDAQGKAVASKCKIKLKIEAD